MNLCSTSGDHDCTEDTITSKGLALADNQSQSTDFMLASVPSNPSASPGVLGGARVYGPQNSPMLLNLPQETPSYSHTSRTMGVSPIPLNLLAAPVMQRSPLPVLPTDLSGSTNDSFLDDILAFEVTKSKSDDSLHTDFLSNTASPSYIQKLLASPSPNVIKYTNPVFNAYSPMSQRDRRIRGTFHTLPCQSPTPSPSPIHGTTSSHNAFAWSPPRLLYSPTKAQTVGTLTPSTISSPFSPSRRIIHTHYVPPWSPSFKPQSGDTENLFSDGEQSQSSHPRTDQSCSPASTVKSCSLDSTAAKSYSPSSTAAKSCSPSSTVKSCSTVPTVVSSVSDYSKMTTLPLSPVTKPLDNPITCRVRRKQSARKKYTRKKKPIKKDDDSALFQTPFPKPQRTRQPKSKVKRAPRKPPKLTRARAKSGSKSSRATSSAKKSRGERTAPLSSVDNIQCEHKRRQSARCRKDEESDNCENESPEVAPRRITRSQTRHQRPASEEKDDHLTPQVATESGSPFAPRRVSFDECVVQESKAESTESPGPRNNPLEKFSPRRLKLVHKSITRSLDNMISEIPGSGAMLSYTFRTGLYGDYAMCHPGQIDCTYLLRTSFRLCNGRLLLKRVAQKCSKPSQLSKKRVCPNERVASEGMKRQRRDVADNDTKCSSRQDSLLVVPQEVLTKIRLLSNEFRLSDTVLSSALSVARASFTRIQEALTDDMDLLVATCVLLGAGHCGGDACDPIAISKHCGISPTDLNDLCLVLAQIVQMKYASFVPPPPPSPPKQRAVSGDSENVKYTGNACE
eukprot:991045_1